MEQKEENTTTEEKKEIQAVEEAVSNALDQSQGENQTEEKQETELTPEEINWRKFREERNKDREARELAEKKAREKDKQIEALTHAIDHMLEAKGGKALSQEQHDQIVADLEDGDLPTGGEIKGFLNKYVPDLIKNALEQQAKQQEEQRRAEEQKNMPILLRKKHKDFDEVVNQENLDYLDYHYPEVAEALGAVRDGVQKWSSIYSTVKKLVPNVGKADLRRIESNAQKPQSVTTATAQPSSEAGYGKSLSEAQKQENYRRLVELARGA